MKTFWLGCFVKRCVCYLGNIFAFDYYILIVFCFVFSVYGTENLHRNFGRIFVSSSTKITKLHFLREFKVISGFMDKCFSSSCRTKYSNLNVKSNDTRD